MSAPSKPAVGTRTRWASDYRAFRIADRLWNRFYEPMRRLDGVPSWVSSAPLPLGLDSYGRLQGDKLAYIDYAYLRRDREHCALVHRCRMAELTRRVRLPR